MEFRPKEPQGHTCASLSQRLHPEREGWSGGRLAGPVWGRGGGQGRSQPTLKVGEGVDSGGRCWSQRDGQGDFPRKTVISNLQ